MRGPSNIPARPVPEDPPSIRLSLEDREPRSYPSTGSWSPRSNGRNRSESPPQPIPEIWKPSSNESTTSRTIAYATGRMAKLQTWQETKRWFRCWHWYLVDDTSPGTDVDQGNEKLWDSIFRTLQEARKGSASVDDHVTAAQPSPDPSDDPEITTFPLTPGSPHYIARHPPYTISSGRLILNNRSSSTDEPRQHLRWYPSPQTSYPRPMRFKSPPRADNDEGFQSSSPGPGPWNPRSSLEETTPIYPTSSPQHEYRPWKRPPFDSVPSNSSIGSLPYHSPAIHQPSKYYDEASDTESDSDEDWRRELKAAFSRPQMEEEGREKTRRRDEELLKEGELQRSFTDEPHQPSQPHRTPSPNTLTQRSSSTTSTLHATPGPFILVDPKSSACRRLINHTFSPRETISLLEVIFTSKAEINMIRGLRGDDAQTFIDVVHRVCPTFLHFQCTF